jgi:hypothetical protein
VNAFGRRAPLLVVLVLVLGLPLPALSWGATQASIVCRSASVVLALDTTMSQADGFGVDDALAAVDGKRVGGAVTKWSTSKALRHGWKADDTRLYPNLLTFAAEGSKTHIGVVIRDKTVILLEPQDAVDLYVSRDGAPEVKEIAHCVWGDGASSVARDWIESGHCAERCAAANPGGSTAECVKNNCKPTPLDAKP